MQIKNNNFVITGAAQGLGAAISVELARNGAKLALLDVNAERLDQVVGDCKQAGASECHAFTCDVADETSVLLPLRKGAMSRPSMTPPSGTSRPAKVANVGYQSIAFTSCEEVWPALIPTPGPHAMQGTRIPVSNVVSLFPRKG